MTGDLIRVAGLGLGGILLLAQAKVQAQQTPPLPTQVLCPGLRIEGEFKPGLSATELRLLCGDPKSQAWKSIPPPQAQFHFRNFLQERGYHHPVFVPEGEGTLVRVGEQTRLSSVEAPGAPPSLRLDRRRKIIGKPLTPELLSSIEQWVVQRLQAAGYPCPRVSSLASSDTGQAIIDVRAGPHLMLETIIEEEQVPGLMPGIFRRHDAFRLGEPFNGDLLSLTAQRINSQNVVQNIHFTPICDPSPEEGRGASVRQTVTPGPPRLLSFGFGIDTEGVLLARAAWRHARLGRSSSWADLTLLGSSREQLLESTINWYALDHPSRHSLRPSVRIRHQNETPFENLEARASFVYATSWDNNQVGLAALLGPSLRGIRTYRGIGPRDSHFLFLDGEMTLTSHQFELFGYNPRSGYRVGAAVSLGSRKFLSTASAQRVELNGDLLLNYRDFDPPLLVLGFRGALATTLTPERPDPATGLPANFFHFLGGSANLRGFGRQELPKNGVGGLSSAFLNTELRLGSTLPYNLEPFVFLDFGALGRDPLSLDRPIYHSPGAGLRWLSPVGVFRTTLARGLPSSVPGHWQFFLSFAEEF